jgi:hypothetical protein
MNCEKCQELVSDLLDGTLSNKDQVALNLHLDICLDCAQVRSDLESIVLFCRNHRGEYSAPPDQRALWVRVRNIIEADQNSAAAAVGRVQSVRDSSWSNWMGRSWELSLPQVVTSVAAIVVLVSLVTVVGIRQWDSPSAGGNTALVEASNSSNIAGTSVRERMWQQQQIINYWNQRVETNKIRWSPEMRETFDRNLKVIDQAVNDSLNDLTHNPHDEVSEEMLNAALHEKLSLLKEFADL